MSELPRRGVCPAARRMLAVAQPLGFNHMCRRCRSTPVTVSCGAALPGTLRDT